MPRIFDNIELFLHTHLRQTLSVSKRADFCVGYFNLRGWRLIDDLVEQFAGGPDNQCRLLVGMQVLPRDELRTYLRLDTPWDSLDNRLAIELKHRVAEEFREQLIRGFPTNEDEAGLSRLRQQLQDGKLRVKLFVGSPLHAKLYLLFRVDANNPITGFLGSSNLTLAGLQKQGELNVDVLEHDASMKLAVWFDDRWKDRWTMDITDELVEILESSWVRDSPIPPYYVYLKMAYHLSREARAGLREFQIPRDLRGELLEFQSAAVRVAAHHINKRGGVIIGDVVGLGKTMMAVTLARIFEDDFVSDSLIICPANLVKMWERYVDRYHLRAKVLSLGAVTHILRDLRRYKLLILDESHNLRNREGVRYAAIREYVEKNDCRCVLLSATPYNKSYRDLSAQLRLFVPEHEDLGIRLQRASVRAALAEHFDLSQEDLQEMLPSGRQRTFHNRVNWAAVYLAQAGLLDRPQRGATRITARGREVLARHPDHIDNTVLAQFPEFQDFLSRAKTTTSLPGERGGGLAEPQATPEEAIDAAYRELRAALAEEVLGRVLDKPADFFETVVLDVLLAMGYGGSREDAAQRLGRTGDQGLDGVIYEDRLGLDMIYVQAKRWTDHPVRRPDVQAFVGALQGARASKGVFITTSRFTEDAADYVTRVQPRVVLIDGRRLARHSISQVSCSGRLGLAAARVAGHVRVWVGAGGGLWVLAHARTLMGWHARSWPQLATSAVWRKVRGAGAKLVSRSSLIAETASDRPPGGHQCPWC